MFKPTIGAAGITYRSEAEAAISFKLLAYGIVSCDEFYPHTFTDTNDEDFHAMSDFQCPYTGIWFEFKSGHVNGLKTKANADKAMSRFSRDLADGFITKRNHNKKLLDASWSDSAAKFKAVQEQTAEAGRCIVLIFDAKPDQATIGRLERSKVFWCIYGDEYFRQFMSFRNLAKRGFRASYEIKGHLFESHGGVGIH